MQPNVAEMQIQLDKGSEHAMSLTIQKGDSFPVKKRSAKGIEPLPRPRPAEKPEERMLPLHHADVTRIYRSGDVLFQLYR